MKLVRWWWKWVSPESPYGPVVGGLLFSATLWSPVLVIVVWQTLS